MAFGFSPKFTQGFQLENLSKEQFLALSVEAASQLGWNISFLNESGFIAYTKFSMSSWGEEITVTIHEERVEAKSVCTGSQLFDWGKNKKNIEDFLLTLKKLRDVVPPEEMERKFTQLKEGYADEGNPIPSGQVISPHEKVTSFISIFKPAEGYFITPILVNINILIFVLMVITGVDVFLPDNDSLLNWGANFRPMTLEGQWWRLFTACFLHIGILHLLMNMYALFYIGLLLEPYLGTARFVAAYLLTGIVASVCSLWWHDLTISAGASGAIFGMYGVFIALLTTNLLDKSVRNAFFTSIAIFVGYNLLNGVRDGIDNAAHIGGLLGGVAAGYAFVPSLKKSRSESIKLSTIGLLTAIVFASSFVVYKSLPNDVGKYDSEIKRFISMEEMALEVFSLPEDTPKEKLLSEIKDKGLFYWRENLKLIDSFKELDLPLEIRERNLKLREYCELRIKSYELIYKTVDEDTDMYENEINEYNQKIEAVINALTGD